MAAPTNQVWIFKPPLWERLFRFLLPRHWRERRVRLFSTAHRPCFVHLACLNELVKDVPTPEEVIETVHYLDCAPQELIERFRDVTHCDQCKREFQPSDRGFLYVRMINRDEMRAVLSVKAKDSKLKLT